MCDKPHAIEKCERFLAIDVNQRAQLRKEKGLCFSCFGSTDHQSRDCPRKARCDVGDCDKYHHPLIFGAAPVFVGTSSVNCVSTTVLLQIVAIAITPPAGIKVNTFALLDSGSQTSLILKTFANTIGVDGENGALHLGTINSPGELVRSRKVSFHAGAVEGTEAGMWIPVQDAWTASQLNLPPQKGTCIPDCEFGRRHSSTGSKRVGGNTTTRCTSWSTRPTRCYSHSVWMDSCRLS